MSGKSNENCLEGIRCPRCGSLEPFAIWGTACFVVYDDGSDEFSNLEWDDESLCRCGSCGHRGKVRDFSTSFGQGIEGGVPTSTCEAPGN